MLARRQPYDGQQPSNGAEKLGKHVCYLWKSAVLVNLAGDARTFLWRPGAGAIPYRLWVRGKVPACAVVSSYRDVEGSPEQLRAANRPLCA
jgi:hypothetical protein